MADSKAIDLVANKRLGKVHNPYDDAIDLIDRFLHTEPRAKSQVESLCLEYCQSCCEAPTPAERRQLCNERRCGLLDPERFRQEQLVIAYVRHQLRYMDSAQSTDVDFLNRHVAQAGGATLALVQGASGHYRLGWNAPTLRAAIHGAVMARLSMDAGDLGSVHALELTGEGAGEVVTELRKRRREGRDRWRAVQMHHDQVPIPESARRLGCSVNTVRGWLSDAGLLVKKAKPE